MPGPHSQEGCRIGDRLDWVWKRFEAVIQRTETESRWAQERDRQCGEMQRRVQAAELEAAALRNRIHQLEERGKS